MTDLEISTKKFIENSDTNDDMIAFKRQLERAFREGYTCGASWQSIQSQEEEWHIRTKDGWTNWTGSPPCEDLIVSVLDDSGDYDYYSSKSAWYCCGVWISRDDIVCGEVVAWKRFPEPCKVR